MKYIVALFTISISTLFILTHSSLNPFEIPGKVFHTDNELTRDEVVRSNSSTDITTGIDDINSTCLGDTNLYSQDPLNDFDLRTDGYVHVPLDNDTELGELVLEPLGAVTDLDETSLFPDIQSKDAMDETAQSVTSSTLSPLSNEFEELESAKTRTDYSSPTPLLPLPSSDMSLSKGEKDKEFLDHPPTNKMQISPPSTSSLDTPNEDVHNGLSTSKGEAFISPTDNNIPSTPSKEESEMPPSQYDLFGNSSTVTTDKSLDDLLGLSSITEVFSTVDLQEKLPYMLIRKGWEYVAQMELVAVIGIPYIAFPLVDSLSSSNSGSINSTTILSDNNIVLPPPEYSLIQHAIQMIRYMRGHSEEPFACPHYIISTWRGARGIEVESFKNSLKQEERTRMREHTQAKYAPGQIQFAFEDLLSESPSPTSSSSSSISSTPPISPLPPQRSPNCSLSTQILPRNYHRQQQSQDFS